MTVYTYTGYADGTDITETPDIAQLNGDPDTLVVNSDGRVDFAISSPIAMFAYESGSVDHTFKVTLYATGGGDFFPLVFGMVDENNAYEIRRTSGGNFELYAYVAGSFGSALGSVFVGSGSIADVFFGTITTFYDEAEEITKRLIVGGINDVPLIEVESTAIMNGTKCGFFARGSTGTDIFTQAEVIPISAQVVTDINSGAAVSGDSVGNTFATTGFTEDITEIVINGLACTNIDETAGSGTFDVPAPIHGEVYPEIGVSHNVEISGATETAALSKSFVLTGYTVTSLVDPELVNTTYPTAHFDVEPVTTDLMITVTADLSEPPTENGGITTDDPKSTIIMHWVRATEVMYIYDFTINDAGVVSGGITMRGLTVTGLTMRGLTMTGL